MPTTLDCALASSLNEDTMIPRRNLHSQDALSKAPAGIKERRFYMQPLARYGVMHGFWLQACDYLP